MKTTLKRSFTYAERDKESDANVNLAEISDEQI